MSVVSDRESDSLVAHVAACDVRYRGFNGRLKRIERVIWGGICALIGLLLTVIGFLVELKAVLT